MFESGAILLYLAEKFGAFLPTEPAARAECLSWLFWQMGSAPYLGGGFGHFYAYAPTKIEYAIDRFAMEVKRQLDVLDRRLAESEYLAGDDYTIADIAVWPWYGALAKGLLYDAGEFLQVQDYTHVQRWTDADRRTPGGASAAAWSTAPGASRASQLHERHDASDFDTQHAGQAGGAGVIGRPASAAGHRQGLVAGQALPRPRSRPAVSCIRVLNQVAMSSKLSPLIDAASVAVAGSPLTNVLPPLDASGHWVRVGLAVQNQEQPHDRVGAKSSPPAWRRVRPWACRSPTRRQ